GAGDRSRPRPAVRFEHVAVDCDRSLADGLEIDDRPQTAADEPLNLRRPAVDLWPAITPLPRRRAARKHVVLGGDPTLPLALHPRRDALFNAGRAEDDRAACLDDDAARGSAEGGRLDRPVAKRISRPRGS